MRLFGFVVMRWSLCRPTVALTQLWIYWDGHPSGDGLTVLVNNQQLNLSPVFGMLSEYQRKLRSKQEHRARPQPIIRGLGGSVNLVCGCYWGLATETEISSALWAFVSREEHRWQWCYSDARLAYQKLHATQEWVARFCSEITLHEVEKVKSVMWIDFRRPRRKNLTRWMRSMAYYIVVWHSWTRSQKNTRSPFLWCLYSDSFQWLRSMCYRNCAHYLSFRHLINQSL